MKIDAVRFQSLVVQLYEIVRQLEEMFPGRPFTPDGHMVGSLGECHVGSKYGIELYVPSTKGKDGACPAQPSVEIKTTQGNSVAFRCEPVHLIVIRLLRNGDFEEIYNGPG